MSVVVIYVVSVVVTTAVFMMGGMQREPREAAMLFGGVFAVALMVSFLFRDQIEQFQQALERIRLRGMSALLYALVLLGFGAFLITGGREGLDATRTGLVLILLIHLLHAYDSRGRAQVMVTTLMLVVLACLGGGSVAVLAVTGWLVGLGLFLVLHHHEALEAAFRIRRTVAPLSQALLCLLYGAVMAGWCVLFFKLIGSPRGLTLRMRREVQQPPPADWEWEFLKIIAILTGLAMLCSWALSYLQRGRKKGESKREELEVARPQRAVPVGAAWTAPPPEAGPRRRIVHLYIRLLEFLQTRGRRRAPHQTPREFAAEDGPEAFGRATEIFYTARYTSAPVSEQDVERFEAAARSVRGGS